MKSTQAFVFSEKYIIFNAVNKIMIKLYYFCTEERKQPKKKNLNGLRSDEDEIQK